MKLLRLLSSVIVLAASTTGTVNAGVIVVQTTQWTGLQAAIDAAVDGDTILVKGGGPFSGANVGGKALTLIAEPIGTVRIGPVRIDGLIAGSTCSVSGFVIVGGAQQYIDVTNCAGAVRFADVGTTGPVGITLIGAHVSNSTNVAFTRCALRGNDSTVSQFFTSTTPEVGLLCEAQSRVALFDCTVIGGHGKDALLQPNLNVLPPGPGANGAEIDGSSLLFASNTTFRGGDGGDGRDAFCHNLVFCVGPHAGQDGGVGLAVFTGSSAKLVEGALFGGAGGTAGMGGPCCAFQPPANQPPDGAAGLASTGSVTTLGVPKIEMIMPTHLRVNESASIVVRGTPGDEVLLAVSTTPTWLDLPVLFGTLVVGPQLRRIAIDTIPASGELQKSISFPELAGVTQAFRLHVQAVAVSPTLGPRLGTGQALCFLGASY